MANASPAQGRTLRHAGSVLLLALLCGCHPAAAPAPPAMPPPQVTVGHPLSKETVDYDEFTARLDSIDSVDIRARVTGYLDKVNFKDGAEVKKGDLLFVIDPRPYQAQVDSAQAALDRARAQLDLAANDNKRALELFQSKAISAEELDTRSKNLTVSTSAVKIAEAAVETAKLNLEYTSISAPISGRVGRAMVREGNLINASGNESTVLTTLVSVDPVYAYADVDQATVVKYQKLDKDNARGYGQIVCDLAIGSSLDFNHHGTLDFVNNQIDPKTGTLSVRGVFPNPDRTLIPGMFGRVRVIGSGKYQAMLIPDYAIGTDQDKKIVFVVKPDNTIETRVIVPGPMVEGLRVIRSGLETSDLVVLDRLQVIRPGATVTPKEEAIKPVPPKGSTATATP